VRQLLVQAPAGNGQEVLRRAQRYGATNMSTHPAEDADGPVDVATLHVPTRSLGELLDELHELPGLCAAFSPENTLALRPPPEDADRQAIEPGNRAPLELLLDSLSAISSRGGFVGYTVLASVVVWIGLVTNTEYLLIAAMLISPFAGPAVNGALGTAHGDRRLLAHGVWRFTVGVALMVGVTAVLSLLVRQQVETALMSEVGRVPLVAVLLPLTAGAAAALHLILSQRASLVTGAAVGTLVAAALAPTAGTAGMALALGRWSMAGEAVFELLLQLVGILLSAALLFRLAGAVTPSAARTLPGRRWWMFPVTMAAAMAGLALLLGAQLTTAGLQYERETQRAREVAKRTVDDAAGATFVEGDIRLAEHGPGGRRTLLGEVYASGDADPEALADEVERSIRDAGLSVVPLIDVQVLPEP
jgi:uncharacterized membrane protein